MTEVQGFFKFYDGLLSGEVLNELYEDFMDVCNHPVGGGEPRNEKMMTYSEHLRFVCQKESRKLFNDIYNHATSLSLDKLPAFTRKILFDLDYYIDKIPQNNRLKNLGYLLEHLREIRNDLVLKFSFLNGESNTQTPLNKEENKSIPIPTDLNSQKIYPRFKWQGNTNVFLTLFYDLISGQDNREPLLEANKKEIKEFIRAHFLDADGNEFSESTIATIFTPGRGEKRANIGDRIELGNVKRK